MTTLASGTKVQVAYVAESTHGTTPNTPSMKLLRCTSRNLNLEKNILESSEVRADRQKADVRHGLNRVGGALGFELMVGGWDDFLASLLGSAWASITIAAVPLITPGNLTVTASSSTVTRAAGSFTADGVVIGMVIHLAGFTNPGNNGNFVVATVGTTTLTVTGMTGTDEGPLAATASIVAYGTLAVNGSTNTITRSHGSFTTDGVLPGQAITFSGFANGGNNGTFVVLSIGGSGTTVTVYPCGNTMVTESATAAGRVSIPGKYLKAGIDMTTFTVERGFLDLDQYQVFKGCIPNQFNLNISPEAIVGGSFDILGMSSPALSGTSLDDTPTAAATNSPLASFDGVIAEAGDTIAIVTGIQFTVNNNRALGAVVGSKFSPDVIDGTLDVTGTATMYFSGVDMFNKFVDEEETTIYVKLNDPNGTDYLIIGFPRVKFTGAGIDPPQSGPIVISMPFRALVDSVAGSCITIHRSNA